MQSRQRLLRRQLTHLRNGTGQGGVTVFPVHVVSAVSAVIANPDTKVLHGSGSLFRDLLNVQQFAVRLLNLSQLGHEAPEARLGSNSVRGEDVHSENLGCHVLGSGPCAANNHEMLELEIRKKQEYQSYHSI